MTVREYLPMLCHFSHAWLVPGCASYRCKLLPKTSKYAAARAAHYAGNNGHHYGCTAKHDCACYRQMAIVQTRQSVSQLLRPTGGGTDSREQSALLELEPRRLRVCARTKLARV